MADIDPTVSSTRKYQVFISSTFRDLSEQRRIVLDVVIDRGHMPIALERFPAADTTVPSVIRKTIEASQIYVVILGVRYGEIVKGRDISFSELEYEDAIDRQKVVIPFLLSDSEVRQGRAELASQRQNARMRAEELRSDTLAYSSLMQDIADLDQELANERKLWAFRARVKDGRFWQPFSLSGPGGSAPAPAAELFDKHMVLKALLQAENEAVSRRLTGWIREPKEANLAQALEAISGNRFLVDVIGAMTTFDPLVPRILDHADEKQAAAAFFADRCLQRITANKVSLFFESGSSVAYAAQTVGRRLKSHGNALQISTNNVVAYLILWLVHRIRCSLFPWGPPEERYGAVFGVINDLVLEEKTPCFPPERLSSDEHEAIQRLLDDKFSPAKWEGPALMLAALSGLQLTRNAVIANCLGPHVGSLRNKVFKRFMYQSGVPLMFFMTADKIDLPVTIDHCHFVLDQEPRSELSWDVFRHDRPVAFCVGCRNDAHDIDRVTDRFAAAGFKVTRSRHMTAHTAVIARNDRFVDDFEGPLGIQD